MRRLYRIRMDVGAPQLSILSPSPYNNEFDLFIGTPKIPLSPKSPFIVNNEPSHPWEQILGIAPGAFAFSENAWRACEDMYYVVSMGSELLSATDQINNYIIVNPLDIAPEGCDPKLPCNMDCFFAPLFRIQNRDPSELYCLSGTEVPGDEFKYNYDKYKFKGLTFEEVWSGI